MPTNSLQQQLGLRTNWHSEDRIEVTRKHKKLWQGFLDTLQDPEKREKLYEQCTPEWKEYLERVVEYLETAKGKFGIGEIPGGLESLEALMGNQGYSISDVGTFVGLKKDRIRQLAIENGLKRTKHGSDYRIWDDDQNRFVTISKEDYLSKAKQVRSEIRDELRKKETRKRHDFARRDQIIAVRELTKELGRPPKVKELEERVGKGIAEIGVHWGYKTGVVSYSRAFDLLYAAAAAVGNRVTREDYFKMSEKEAQAYINS